MNIGNLFGFVAAIIGTAYTVPQLVLLIRRGTARGVSIPAWVFQAVSSCGWIAYGIHIGSIPQIVGNLAPITGSSIIIFIAMREQGKRIPKTTPLWIALLGVFLVFTPTLLLGFIAGIGSLFARWPQVAKSWQSRKHSRPTDVSTLSYTISITAMSCWLAYGILSKDWPVAVINSILIVSVASILFNEVRNPARVNRPVLATV